MRSSILVASFVALVAALPAISVEETSLAVRTESFDATALESRQTVIPFDRTYSWPDTQIIGGGLSAQFQATNQGNNYKFQFWNSAPPNSPTLNYRVSYGGNTLVSVNLSTGQTTTVNNVPKTGDNFNVFIQAA